MQEGIVHVHLMEFPLLSSSNNDKNHFRYRCKGFIIIDPGNLMITNRALNLSIVLSDLYFILYTHLHPRAHLSFGSSSIVQVPLRSKAWSSFSMAERQRMSLTASE